MKSVLYWRGGRSYEMVIDDAGKHVATHEISAPKFITVKEWLLGQLAAGPVRSGVLLAAAGRLGYSRRYLRNVAERCKVRIERRGGYAGAGAWYWSLPELPDEDKI